MARFLSLLALFLSSAHAAEVLFQVGDFCNVTSRDFLSPDFLSDHAVAGPGCQGSNDETGCFCAPVLNNNESLSDWVWQCGDDVNFGPTGNKICPAEVPVPFVAPTLNETMNGTMTSVESMLGVGAYCNLTLHPGGRFGDEACPYSTCEEGGDYSAVCACVDLEGRDVEGGGQQWFCLHSKCGCGNDDHSDEDEDDHSGHDHGKDNTTKPTGTATGSSSGTPPLSMITAAVASFVVSML